MSYLDKLKPLDSGNSKSAGNPTPSTGYTSKLQPYEEKNTEKKQGFLEKMARGIVSPVATLAARPFQLGAELLGASPEKVDKFSEKYSAGLVAPTPKTGGDIVKDIGRGLETVSLGIGGGGIKTAGKEVLKGATKQAIKQGFKEGTIAGGIGGLGSGLEQGQNLPSSIGTGAIGAVTGGVLGGAIGGGASVIKNKIAPTPEYLGKNLDTRIRKALEGTTGDATLIEEKAFKAKKALQLLTSESEGLSIPDTSASLGSGKTKPFDITKAKPNELVSAVVEMGKKIATNARQTAERASNFGKKVNIDEAIGKVKRAVDDGVIPKATGARLEKQLNNLGNDPLKTHDWIEEVNKKYKNKYERGTISDTALGGVADDVADALRSQLDSIVDRKGYAEAFGNNQELKRIIVQAAKKANKNVNFGDVSSDAGLDAAISVITGNPAYMARTVGSGIFRGLISSFRNQSPIRNLKKAADLTKRVSSISKLPSSEIKGGSQLALPSPESGIRSEIRASNPIKVAPLGSNMEFTGKGNFIDNIKPLPKNEGLVNNNPLLTGAGVTGIGAIGAGAFPEKSKEQFTPVQKKVNDSREEFKRRISTVENEALVTRGKDAYKSVGTTGDLGKYQVNPKSLKDWGKAWLGKEVSKSEFLGSPKLQEEFFSEFQNVVDRLKLSPEEAAIAWHSGWGILGKDRQTTTRQERDNEFRQYIKRKMREDEPRRYLSKFNNVK